MKIPLWLIACIAVAALAVAAYMASLFGMQVPFMPQGHEPEQVFCTADAMQCPDGSWVGRTGPNCEFVCPQS